MQYKNSKTITSVKVTDQAILPKVSKITEIFTKTIFLDKYEIIYYNPCCFREGSSLDNTS